MNFEQIISGISFRAFPRTSLASMQIDASVNEELSQSRRFKGNVQKSHCYFQKQRFRGAPWKWCEKKLKIKNHFLNF